MANRTDFAKKIAEQNLSHVERAIAFLFFYRESQQFEERTASALAADLAEESFPKPNVTTLKSALTKSKFTLKGKQKGSFKLDLRKIPELIEKFGIYLNERRVEVPDAIIPHDWVAGTRTYLEKMVHQINGCYSYGFMDACSVLCRRLMESLIIEIYIHEKRQHEIQSGGVFIFLEKLIKYATNDPNIVFGRNVVGTMNDVKQLGDTAAHDRTYITPPLDIDDLKAKYRRLIKELLTKAGIA